MKIKTDVNNILVPSEKIVEKVKGGDGTKRQAEKGEEVSISDKGRLFNEVKRAVAESEDVRAEKVEEVKKKLESGYTVDDRKLAEKLAEEFLREALF